MSAPLAVAGYVTAYASRTPYLTVAEYTAAPTAVNATNLVAGGSQAQNLSELGNVIGRASSMADTICHKVLAATRDIDGPKRLRVNQSGTVRYPLRFTPVLEVDAISIGLTPSTMTAFNTTNVGNLIILPTGVVEIPVWGAANGTPYPGFGPWLGSGAYPLVQVTYVNGWPNTILAANAVVNATSILVQDALGIYPGSQLTIYDDTPGNEPIIVASTYTIGSTTVPLVSGLQYAHSAGMSVSALPPAIKQAVIHLTSALIKTRGALSIVAGKLQQAPTKTQLQDTGAEDDIAAADWLLAPYVRVR